MTVGDGDTMGCTHNVIIERGGGRISSFLVFRENSHRNIVTPPIKIYRCFNYVCIFDYAPPPCEAAALQLWTPHFGKYKRKEWVFKNKKVPS